MILIGSLAAKLTNCLPLWRNGKLNDIDLVGTLNEFHQLVTYIKSQTDLVYIAESSIKGRYAITVYQFEDRILIEFNTNITSMTEILKSMPDNTSGSILGFPCEVISLRSQYAIKKAYRHIPIIHQEKNLKDLQYWKSIIDTDGKEYLPDHIELFKSMWNETKEIFK